MTNRILFVIVLFVVWVLFFAMFVFGFGVWAP